MRKQLPRWESRWTFPLNSGLGARGKVSKTEVCQRTIWNQCSRSTPWVHGWQPIGAMPTRPFQRRSWFCSINVSVSLWLRGSNKGGGGGSEWVWPTSEPRISSGGEWCINWPDGAHLALDFAFEDFSLVVSLLLFLLSSSQDFCRWTR